MGTIGTNGGGLYIGSLEGSDAYLAFASNTIYPATNVGAARDDAIDLGSASARFDDIYATNNAMFISSTWWEKEISVDAVEADEANNIEAKDAYTYMDIKDEATEGYTQKTRLGVRYSELLAFIISAI